MSEPTNLVPNLNEIMEEYAERENETVQSTQAVVGQGEERDELNEEPEQTKNLSSQWKNLKRGKKEMKRQEQRVVKKNLLTGSRISLMSPGRINCSIETSLGREASTSGFLHSQRS